MADAQQQPDAVAAVAPLSSFPQPSPQSLLTEDEADDLLYCARTGDLAELQTVLAEIATRLNDATKTPLALLAAARDASHNTPLHMAAANGHAAVVGFLLEQAVAAGEKKDAGQAFVDAANTFGNTALHWAALNGRLAVVKVLVEGPPRASVALANDKNYIPLDLASLNGHGAVAAYFMAEAEGRAAQSAREEEEEAQKKEESQTQETKDDGETRDKEAATELSTATEALALEP